MCVLRIPSASLVLSSFSALVPESNNNISTEAFPIVKTVETLKMCKNYDNKGSRSC
jgi:hypothetical protein